MTIAMTQTALNHAMSHGDELKQQLYKSLEGDAHGTHVLNQFFQDAQTFWHNGDEDVVLLKD